MYSTASLATDSRIASYWRAPTATRTAGRAAPERAVDRRAQRVLDHPPRAIGLRAVEQLVAHVAERDDVVGDDPGVDVGDLGLAAQEQAVDLERPDPALGSTGSKIIHSATQLVT